MDIERGTWYDYARVTPPDQVQLLLKMTDPNDASNDLSYAIGILYKRDGKIDLKIKAQAQEDERATRAVFWMVIP